MAASGAAIAPDPGLVHAQIGDHIQPDSGGRPLVVARRTWRTGAGGPMLELLLDWPVR